MSTAPTSLATVATVMHFHVVESHILAELEVDPDVTDDPALALDRLAHGLADWSEDNSDDEDALYAAGVAEIYCDCTGRGRSPDHGDAVTRLKRGQGICETVDEREFTVLVCHDRDCLDDCRTVVAAANTDP